MDTQTLLALLKTYPIFGALTTSQLTTCLASATLRHVSDGDVLYKRGERSDQTFCLILTGSLQVLHKNGQVEALRQAGDILGEIALFIPQRQRTFTVIAPEPTTLLILEFEQVKHTLPFLRRELFKLVSKRLPPDFVLD